jgi:hypothetical protein
MLELADVKKADVVYDLASGDGRIMIRYQKIGRTRCRDRNRPAAAGEIPKGSRSGSRKYSPPRIAWAEKIVFAGNPNQGLISTSYVEKLNATRVCTCAD